MWCRIRQIFSKLLLLGALVLLLFAGISYFAAPPAAASIRQTQEAPGQTLYQSRHSLRDRAGHSWQLILFKRVKSGEVASVNLRLVGFPGMAEVAHPQPLQINTDQGKVFSAPDLFAEESPAPNVGQYDLKGVLLQLPTTQPAILSVPLVGDRSLDLPVPPPVLLEWQTVANS
ncbi:DUF3122 domain-containing protein [Phormidium sp. CCY1219]|uniref:DUF3122 domain-containing protein n=1 Tax=Phormidium sp. CCY1219 TaxID=2886104 RepID=UPI002D1F1D73|nr:DUF3122 domain-containing protein [Phormidium sp. CCY1219]MEB3827858.1 DUF3122 domain-containing protein [Phormidium sp. CCY1219]